MTNNRYKKSKEFLDRACKVLASGVSSEFRKYNNPHALFYDHAEGSKIVDVDGNEYIDFTLSQGPLILGHSNESVLNAVDQYSRKGQLFAGQHIKEIELAEKLNKIIPSAELMRFCLDGSEAVQTAFRVARSKTKKNLFLRFEGHYHGWLDNVAYGISVPLGEDLGERNNPKIFPWCNGLSKESKSEFVIIPWNDEKLLEETIEKYKDELAAVITEPIMCNNGCIVPKKGFLEKMRILTEKNNIALIFDEVITGFRIGLSGAQGYFNIKPDLSIFAKAMGSGYPISAIVGKKEWMEEISSGRVIHAGTMNSSNPTIAASLATINALENDKNVYQRLFELGNELKDGLKNLAKKHNQNLYVQGPGPMLSTIFTDLEEVTDFRGVIKSDKTKLNKFISLMHDNGIRIIGRGLWYISATTSKDDIKTALKIADKVLTEI
ncbi:aspartate aminotransferase family protein [Sphingobacterium daejeonense]|uniref:Aspartate aminotransferase family protein n=1 Tax=Sphingobacterium daejeonense TaxID=371142 RepID=A0ABW3RK38_9SPHI